MPHMQSFISDTFNMAKKDGGIHVDKMNIYPRGFKDTILSGAILNYFQWRNSSKIGWFVQKKRPFY